MKISIVTPVFNEPRVGRALDSVFDQRHDHTLEAIVIDGGSHATTLDVLERYRTRLSVLESEPDGGIYEAMNKGIHRATGDVIGILNADDRYAHADVLGKVADTFERYDDVHVCYGNMVYMDDAGHACRYWRAGANLRYKWYVGWRPPHPTFFVRRQVYETHGLFNLDYRIASDYEMQLRLLFMHRLASIYLDQVLVHMAPGGNSNKSLRNVARANLEVRRAWRRNNLRGGLLVPMLKPISKFPQFLRRPPGDGAERQRSDQPLKATANAKSVAR